MRNHVIREAEEAMIAYRARNLFKQPVHPGATVPEYLAERRRKRIAVWGLAAAVLLGVVLVVLLRVLH